MSHAFDYNEPNEDRVSENKDYLQSWYLLKRCLSYFAPYKFKMAFAMLSMLVVAAASGASAYLVKPALDDIFINKDAEALYFLPPLFILVVSLKGIGRFYQNYFMQSCGIHVLEQLRNELYAKMIRLPIRFFDDNQVGMLMSRIIYDVMAIRSSIPSVVMFIRQIFTMVFLIGVVIYQDAYLAFWAILVLPLALFPFIYFGRKIRKLGRKNQVKLADISVILQEIFSGVKVVKAFANEDAETRGFAEENAKLNRVYLKELIYNELSSPVMELIGAIGMGLVILYGGLLVIEGKSTPGTLFSFMTALIMLYEPIKKMSSSNKDIQKALAGGERVFEILDSPEITVEDSGNRSFPEELEKIELRGVSFAYPGCAEPVLCNVNLTVKAGEKVAIVGPSGSGKTTLVNLIPRFYVPQNGEIYINGIPGKELTLKSLRLNIGMVSQDTFLFNKTIKENIAYGNDSFSMDEVIASANAAFAHDFIQATEESYDTVIGERGVKISGGQKQRLTIARALFKNPPLLILDEATSALDTESERIVQSALENLMKNRTSIVIAHRLSTVLNADRIIVMQKGQIVGEGKHADLLESSPLYAKLYAMQFEDFSEPIVSTCAAGELHEN